MIAEVSLDLVGPLLQTGIPGVVLAWFMLRSETRFRGMERAVNRMSRSVLLLVVALNTSNEAMRAEADKMLARMPSDSED
jgi:hypothetical protein